MADSLDLPGPLHSSTIDRLRALAASGSLGGR
jgi:hypothetical protein